ncbi:hypothetical protein I552_9150 [Mycobacterium xenopi 3993]|nr:hypothetical protein I552_9150 [Mycobacterium xenopi 3993]
MTKIASAPVPTVAARTNDLLILTSSVAREGDQKADPAV